MAHDKQRFYKAFKQAQQQNRGVFIPFVTLGDPSYQLSLEIIKCLIDNGADALELGLPFSDPCADGEAIQKANHRALAQGMTTQDCFNLIHEVRQYHENIPISIMAYSNLAVAQGVSHFYQMAYQSGVDAVLLPDIPVAMLDCALAFKEAAKQAKIDLVLIAPPNAQDDCLEKIAQQSEGYTYVLSRFGITGTAHKFGKPQEIIAKLATLKAAPSILGFGISQPEHVKEALQIGAKGVVTGSALVKIIEQNLDNQSNLLSAIAKYEQAMVSATYR